MDVEMLASGRRQVVTYSVECWRGRQTTLNYVRVTMYAREHRPQSVCIRHVFFRWHYFHVAQACPGDPCSEGGRTVFFFTLSL